jgi:hypothetical protein
MFKEEWFRSRDNVSYVILRHMLANSLDLQDMMELYLKQGITAIDVVRKQLKSKVCPKHQKTLVFLQSY